MYGNTPVIYLQHAPNTPTPCLRLRPDQNGRIPYIMPYIAASLRT